MLNHIDIMGRMVRDPELKRTNNGTAVTSFTIAVDRDFSGEKKEVDFIECVSWRQTAEHVSKFFKKGSMIVASGRLQIRVWQDKDGNKRSKAEVVADSCYFGEAKRSNSQSEPQDTSSPEPDFALLEDDDCEIPF